MEQLPLFTRITDNGMYSIDRCNYTYPATGVVKPFYIHKYVRRYKVWVFVKAYKTLRGAQQYYNRLTKQQ